MSQMQEDTGLCTIYPDDSVSLSMAGMQQRRHKYCPVIWTSEEAYSKAILDHQIISSADHIKDKVDPDPITSYTVLASTTLDARATGDGTSEVMKQDFFDELMAADGENAMSGRDQQASCDYDTDIDRMSECDVLIDMAPPTDSEVVYCHWMSLFVSSLS